MTVFIKGKYAQYVNKLNKVNDKKTNCKPLLPTNAHLYIFCALYGCNQGSFHEFDPTQDFIINAETDEQKEIKNEYFDRDGLNKYRAIILLSENHSDRSSKEKIDAAFKHDYMDMNDEIRKENDRIIDGYALSGLEKIYEKFGKIDDQETLVIELNKFIERYIEAQEQKKESDFDPDYE